MRQIAVVTGGAGFIGSHMVDFLLAEGFFVNIIDNFSGGHEKNLQHLKHKDSIKIWKMDIRDLEEGHEAFRGCNYVFHFAGVGDIVPSISNPMEYMDVNVLGTIRVLECARVVNVNKFVYAASSSCYGLAKTPTNEVHEINPMYPYALSKYQGEQAVFHWGKVYGMNVNSVCIFNAYGPRVRTTGAYGAVFGVFLKQFLESKPLTVVGDGSQKRDFVYVKDVVKAFYLAAHTKISDQRYNLGAGSPQSIKYLAKMIGGDVEFIPKRDGEPDSTFADITKIKAELGWAPEVTFEEGVNIMLENIKDWQDAPLWDASSIKEATKVWVKYMRKEEDYDS